MVTIIGIILADVIVLLIFLYSYRQELGFTVSGQRDWPVLRARPPRPARNDATDDQAKGGQVMTNEGKAPKSATHRPPQNA